MIIYLASGFTVICKEGREKELSKKFDSWNRLQSYYFLKFWEKGTFELLKKKKRKKDENK